jgi:hypothetical protein
MPHERVEIGAFVFRPWNYLSDLRGRIVTQNVADEFE